MVLNTIHNIRHYVGLMEKVRTAIQEDRFSDLKKEYEERTCRDGVSCPQKEEE